MEIDGPGLLNTFAEVVLGAVVTAVGWLLVRVDKIKTMAETSQTRISNLEKQQDGFAKIPERLASLEATVNTNMKGLQDTLSRLEAHMMRKDGED